MAKSVIRLQARDLRRNGLGIKTIAHQLGVSSSTVSLWSRDIELTKDQIKKLEQNSHDPNYGRRLAYSKAQQAVRTEKIAQLFSSGIKTVGSLNQRELFIAGICLYWAEGFKKDNLVGFSNSDPDMVKFFLYWLEKSCGVEKARFKFRLGINEQYKDKAESIKNYWVDVLGVPDDAFQKTYIQNVLWKKKYDHPEDYHGVLRIRVSKSTDLLRTIFGWIGGLKLAIK